MTQFLFKKKPYFLLTLAITTVILLLVTVSLTKQTKEEEQVGQTQVLDISQDFQQFRFSLPKLFKLISIKEEIKAGQETPSSPPTSQATTNPTKADKTVSTTKTQHNQTLAEQILTLTNKARADNNLPALKSDYLLNSLAQQRSRDMATNNYFLHIDPSGATAYLKLLKENGVAYKSAAENIGKNNYPDSQTTSVVFNTWMQSLGHRSNILNPNFNSIGIGVATNGSGMKYYTQIFVGN